MTNLKVVEVKEDSLVFDNGYSIESDHDSDCCEWHWLEFKDLELKDFEGLEFDLSNDNFFKRIPDYGIELIPIKGWSVKIAGHGANNGFYSSDLSLLIRDKANVIRSYDITECQNIDWD